jgi:hypothetical protein
MAMKLSVHIEGIRDVLRRIVPAPANFDARMCANVAHAPSRLRPMGGPLLFRE